MNAQKNVRSLRLVTFFLKEFTNAYDICRFLFLRSCLRLDDNVRGKVGHVIGDEVLCLSYT